jgi:hypothetical protein
MGLLGTALTPLRVLLGSIEREVEHTIPVKGIEGIQERVLETGEAIRKATEQIEQHVEVLESLASSVPQLTEAVGLLTVQLGGIVEVLRPVAAMEADVAKVGRLFGRHRGDAPATAE